MAKKFDVKITLKALAHWVEQYGPEAAVEFKESVADSVLSCVQSHRDKGVTEDIYCNVYLTDAPSRLLEIVCSMKPVIITDTKEQRKEITATIGVLIDKQMTCSTFVFRSV